LQRRAKKLKHFKCTDLGNAQRLVQYFGRNIRYCRALGQWFVWNDIRWAIDTDGAVERWAKAVTREILHEAAAAPDKDKTEQLARWAIASQSERALNAMVRLAQSEPGIPVAPDELDANPFLLNCINGTVNLLTGKLQRQRREDYITKLSPVTFNAKARDEI